MVFFDVTKTSRQNHASGIRRTARRLGDSLEAILGESFVRVAWNGRRQVLCDAATRRAVVPERGDWFFSVEPFSPDERRGFPQFIENGACRFGAVFHDAIPLKYPEFTWPQSVARYPSYMKMLGRFDHVFGVSTSSCEELGGYFNWLESGLKPAISLIRPGADLTPGGRPLPRKDRGGSSTVLMVGILEPRKNQQQLLRSCEILWEAGLQFELQLVGRVNPHFGKPLVREIRRLGRAGRTVEHRERVSDRELLNLVQACRFSVFPSRAEGCGLPILESLWMGVPCVCSDLPSHRESAAGGGCLLIEALDEAAWVRELRVLLEGEHTLDILASEAANRSLPIWRQTAEQVVEVLMAEV